MEPRIDLRWRVPLPVFRRLRVYASESGTTARFDTASWNPLGWLVQVAQRRMIDLARSEIARRNREAAVADETDIAVPATQVAPA